jgi:hypothetical protein
MFIMRLTVGVWHIHDRIREHIPRRVDETFIYSRMPEDQKNKYRGGGGGDVLCANTTVASQRLLNNAGPLIGTDARGNETRPKNKGM